MVALVHPARMSVQEFLAWHPEDGGRYELVDGEPRAMAPANRTHGTLQARLAQIIANTLDRQGGPCTVVTAPGVIPRFLARHNMRIPDLAVTCSAYHSEELALTEPVLIVEILSPGNQAKTWANVWAYTSIPSVREILVLRADRIGAELLRRPADGGWPEQPGAIAEGDLVLASIGLTTKLAALYAGTRLAP